MMRILLSDISIPQRTRSDLGDINSLAESMRQLGLLHPIGLTRDDRLLFGVRRLAAAKQLGWSHIETRTLGNLSDAISMLVAERDENTCRKAFVPSEAVALGKRLEKLERPKAKERQAKAGKSYGRGKKPIACGKLPQAKSKTRDRVSVAMGMSGRTYEKARAVVESGKSKLITQMDRTGNVDGAYRQLRQKEDEARILSVRPVSGKYRTLVIDPPWDHEGFSLAGRGRPDYAVMSQEELSRLPVRQWAADECHLYLWVTNNFLLRAGELVDAWGFQYKTVLTWVKPKMGLGSYFRSSTEHVLFAVLGSVSTRAKDIPTHFNAPATKHSAKPDAFYDIVRRASYPPYGEAFQRQQRDGFANLFTTEESRVAL